jgi:hypothetical protein
MKLVSAIVLCAIQIAGCAPLNPNMTPDQRAAMYQMMMQNNNQQQQMQQQNLLAEQQALARAAQTQPSVNCTTTYVGNQAYTSCH